MADIQFVFKKTGFEDYTETRTVHDLGKFRPIFPSHITYNTPFVVTVFDLDGLPVEGVEVFIDDVKQSETDSMGKITLTVPKE